MGYFGVPNSCLGPKDVFSGHEAVKIWVKKGARTLWRRLALVPSANAGQSSPIFSRTPTLIQTPSPRPEGTFHFDSVHGRAGPEFLYG